jgi:hypothetical protein
MRLRRRAQSRSPVSSAKRRRFTAFSVLYFVLSSQPFSLSNPFPLLPPNMPPLRKWVLLSL